MAGRSGRRSGALWQWTGQSLPPTRAPASAGAWRIQTASFMGFPEWVLRDGSFLNPAGQKPNARSTYRNFFPAGKPADGPAAVRLLGAS